MQRNLTLTYLYSAYGLHLSTDLAIPHLRALPAPHGADVRVWFRAKPPICSEESGTGSELLYTSPGRDKRGQPVLTVSILGSGAYYCFLYSDQTQFIVERCGREVWGVWSDPFTLEDALTYLLGPVLGFVLRLRGVVSLHAGAVAVGEQAIALVGAGGAGKSTLAAAFARLGLAVLSDDVLPLFEQGESFLAQPGYPRLGLWPESVSALYGSFDALPPVTPNWEKRYLALDGNGYRFQPEPLPLRAIYILDRRVTHASGPTVETEPAASGLIALLAHTYVNYLLDRDMRRREFELLGRLAVRVPLRRVKLPDDPARLFQVCHAVLEDVQMLPAAAVSILGRG